MRQGNLTVLTGSMIKGEENNCLAPCSGLVVNSFFKTGPNNNIEGLIWEKIAAYDKFMKWMPFPSKLKGALRYLCRNENQNKFNYLRYL